MTCSNCQHGWCWFCGFAVGHDGYGLLFHIPCTIFVESLSSVKGWKKVGVIILIVLGIILLPALYALLLAGYFIFGVVYGTYILIVQDYYTLPKMIRLNWSKNLSIPQIVFNTIVIILELLLFWALSLVLLAVAAALTVILTAFSYLLIIFSLFFATI